MATMLGGAMIPAVGFVTNEVQSRDSIYLIRLFFAGLPSAAFVFGAILFSKLEVREGSLTEFEN